MIVPRMQAVFDANTRWVAKVLFNPGPSRRRLFGPLFTIAKGY
jgi:hypothetical protein